MEQQDNQKPQGEGNREADERYRERTREFVENEDTERLGKQAAEDLDRPADDA
ncbi:MAG: hypothetical protein ACE37F_32510 [Nannocystaceae bacterium]|nr:hypothetical protein [bacterium]